MGFFSKLFGGGKKSDYGQAEYKKATAAAATKNAEIAEKSMTFSQDFYNKYVAPQLETMTASTKENDARARQLFDLQFDQAKLQDQRYRQYGIPAEDRYFRMVDEYSAPEEEERQAGMAIGDLRVAQGNQSQQLNRALAARGIDPTSPAAVAAMTDASVMNTVAQAAAANRARTAAKNLGMQLKSDAANFGRGGMAGIQAFSSGAGNAATSAASMQNASLAATNAGGAIPMQGYGTALQGYGQNLNAYSNLTGQALNAKAKADAANAEGLGGFLGTIGGIGLKYALGGPAALAIPTK